MGFRQTPECGFSEDAVPVRLVPVKSKADWAWFGERFEPRKPILPEQDGQPYYWGSSLDFDDWLRENKPHLIIPEREIVPLDGAIAWTPRHEDDGAEMCPRCGGGFVMPPLCIPTEARIALLPCSYLLHRIRPCDHDERGKLIPSNRSELADVCPLCRGLDIGSRLFCPKCNGSGFDRKADKQREIAGVPAPEREAYEARRGGSTPGGASGQSPPPDMTQDRPLTRRERRRRQFARQDAAGAHDGDGRIQQVTDTDDESSAG